MAASSETLSTATLGPVLTGTVVVGDLDAASAAYADLLGHETETEGEISASLATAWSAPQWSGRPYRVLSPGIGRPGGIRLIQKADRVSHSPLHTQGWRALEIAAENVDSLRARVDGSAFRVAGEPKGLTNVPDIRAMQLVGPGNVMVYLTTTVQGTAFDLPSAARPVDGIFVAVLACEIPAAAEFYGRVFGCRPPHGSSEVPLEAVNRVLGLPLNRRHTILTLQLAGRSLMELDRHPEELLARRPPPNDLPDGIPVMTFAYAGSLDSLTDLGVRITGNLDEVPYRGTRVGVLIGPAGERLELVESAQNDCGESPPRWGRR